MQGWGGICALGQGTAPASMAGQDPGTARGRGQPRPLHASAVEGSLNPGITRVVEHPSPSHTDSHLAQLQLSTQGLRGVRQEVAIGHRQLEHGDVILLQHQMGSAMCESGTTP